MEVIDMIKRAIGILEREMAKSGASMLQLQNTGSVVQDLNVSMQASALSAKDGAKLSALVQESRLADQDAEAGAPEAATYEGHSSGIIETLVSQLEEAHGQLYDTKTNLAQSGEETATAQADLSVTAKALAADTATLEDLHKDCLTKAQDFEAETKSRSAEL